MDEVGLGQVLQQARKRAGLTQQQLCQQAGISYSTLAKIERGAIKAPSIFTIQSIVAVLGTDLNTILGSYGAHGPMALKAAKKRSKSGIRFVYFDVNGCMVRFFHRAFTQLAEDTGVSASRIETTFWHYNDAVCRGDMSLTDFNVALAEQLGVPTVDWQRYYLAAIDPIPEMQQLVGWAQQHYRVGLLSNIMPGFIKAMIARKLLPALPYDAVVDSSEVGAIKPEADMYAIATTQAGVSPSEILLVDDSRANLMAAERAGWQVLWFDDYRPDESVERIRQALEFEE